MTIDLREIKRWYSGEHPHQKTAIESLGKELRTRGFREYIGTDIPDAAWLNFSDERLADIQNKLGAQSIDKFTRQWRNEGYLDWYDMSSKVSKYFTVGEVTNNETRRIPRSADVCNNILTLAKELDKIREAWGSPIIVTSWYRPYSVNKSVGGSRYSQHLTGRAVDIYPANGKGLEFEKWLDNVAWKDKALGYGQKAGRNFTHLDLRQGRIRWNY